MNNRLTKNLGFTLMELLVTISIVGILAGLALPSFVETIRGNRLTTQTNEFVTALNFARSESARRGKVVVIRKTGTNWENGWQIFADIDRSTPAKQGVFDDSTPNTVCEVGVDCLLRVYPAMPANFTLRGSKDTFIQFNPDGSANTTSNENFVMCDNRDGNNLPEANTAKLISINITGRPSIMADTDNNGVPNLSTGANIATCATVSAT